MRPSLRTASIWAFSALFGCVSLFGQGWHSLVGEYHGAHIHAVHGSCCAPAHSAREHVCHEQFCQKHSETVAPHDDVDGEFSKHASAPTVHEAGGDEHYCPICSFFGQAQCNGVFQPVDLIQVSCELTPVAGPAVAPARVGIYQSRGPPIAAVI
jgi:hypothetical protein